MHAIFNLSFVERLAGLLRLLMLTTLFSVAGIVSISAWQSYGEAARLAIANRVPRLAATISPRPELGGVTVGRAMQAASSGERMDGAAGEGALAADSAQLLQSLQRDVAAMGRDMAELKERLGRLAAGQDQMTRDLAKTRQSAPRPDVRSAMAAAPATAASPQSSPATPDARRPVLPPTILTPRPR